MRGHRLGADGARAYRALHGLDAGPPRVVPLRLPRGYLADVGTVTALDYERLVDEGVGPSRVPYRHAFRRGHGPVLAVDADGWGFLLGGRYEISDHGIEDTTMRHYFYRPPHSLHPRAASPHFVPMALHFRRNPDTGAVARGVAAIAGGLVAGVAANAAVQALPESRVSANVKDGAAVAIALAAALLPGPGTARLVGISAATGLGLALANRRFAVSDRVAAWVDQRARDLYARLLPAGGAPPGGVAPVAPTGEYLPEGRWS